MITSSLKPARQFQIMAEDTWAASFPSPAWCLDCICFVWYTSLSPWEGSLVLDDFSLGGLWSFFFFLL